MNLDPKFEANLKPRARSWQFSPHGDYHYGQCPQCGESANCVGDSPLHGSDFEREDYFECECGCKFHYFTTTAYKFGDIDQD